MFIEALCEQKGAMLGMCCRRRIVASSGRAAAAEFIPTGNLAGVLGETLLEPSTNKKLLSNNTDHGWMQKLLE
jgi:hypothetical protein